MSDRPGRPSSLFYFSASNSDDRKGWVKEILVDSKVYFRSRAQLNDPSELRPSLEFRGTDKELRAFAKQTVYAYGGKASPAKRLKLVSEFVHQYQVRPERVEELLHQVLDRIGVLCLSEDSTAPTLWAHYADGHQGLAIEFDSSAGLFDAAQKVIYSDARPVINRLKDGPRALFDKAMSTKGKAWESEQEWRVIARYEDNSRIERQLEQLAVSPAIRAFLNEQHGPGHYSIPSNAIRSVVLGAKMSQTEEDWVRALLNDAPGTVALRRARLDKYGAVSISQLGVSR